MIVGRPIRRAMLAVVVMALLGLGGLVLAGALDQRSTAFSLQIPNSVPVVVLKRHEQVCQGPVAAQAAFRGVQLWLGAVSAPGAVLEVNLHKTNGSSPVSGTVPVSSGGPSTTRVWFVHAIAARTRLTICLENLADRRVALIGAGAGPYSGALVRAGHVLGTAAAMVMLSPRPRSMIALLPTIFRRAALFRPSWVGVWTYWILLIGMVGVFLVAALALRLAVREDADSYG